MTASLYRELALCAGEVRDGGGNVGARGWSEDAGWIGECGLEAPEAFHRGIVGRACGVEDLSWETCAEKRALDRGVVISKHVLEL